MLPQMHDFDWLVIGSGFGGSVSAMRLAEHGKRVGVLESGRRFTDDTLPSSTWSMRNYYFLPRLRMKGILRLSVFKDVFILSGAGVGGGSLGYANTLYRAPDRFYEDPQWAGLAAWKAELAGHYDTAEHMLGVTNGPGRRSRRRPAARVRPRDRLRGHLLEDARRRLLRSRGGDGPRPVLRRFGA
jgi:cholesterol oxidase